MVRYSLSACPSEDAHTIDAHRCSSRLVRRASCVGIRTWKFLVILFGLKSLREVGATSCDDMMRHHSTSHFFPPDPLQLPIWNWHHRQRQPTPTTKTSKKRKMDGLSRLQVLYKIVKGVFWPCKFTKCKEIHKNWKHHTEWPPNCLQRKEEQEWNRWNDLI